MKIAVLSDIHDNIWALKAVLANLPPADALVCCGDLCSPFVVGLLAGGFGERPVHLIFGNNDGDLFRITKNAAEFPQVTIHGEFLQMELDGRRIAAQHFDNIALEIARSETFDVVFYGHNHRYAIEQAGRTLAVNPGAVMGYSPLDRADVPVTFVIYDTKTDQTQGYRVPQAPGGAYQPPEVFS